MVTMILLKKMFASFRLLFHEARYVMHSEDKLSEKSNGMFLAVHVLCASFSYAHMIS